MLNEDVLNQALVKKNKEVDLLNERNERMKNEFNAQKKNLMNSISTLQKKLEKIETESHSDKRVEIINKLREERKDQQQTILLLRKYILNSAKEDKEAEELKLNKYLIEYRKEKYGEQRYISYEELKIQLDELEKKYQILKKSKGGAPTSTRSYMNPKEKTKKIPESEIQLLVVKKFKNQLNEYDIKIKNLENENNILKKQKEEMENKQKEMIDRFKNFNEEMTKMKSLYNDIEQELKTDAYAKVNELNLKLAKSEQENNNLKERIEELIKIGEESKINEQNELNKIKNENDIYKNLLLKNKEEIRVYKEELENFRGEINKIDSRGLVKLKKLENEKDEILRDKNDMQIKMDNFGEIIKNKDYQISNLKNNIEALKEQLKEKDEEIEMLKSKIEEFERIIKNHKNINYSQEKESDYEYSQSHFND